MKDDFYDLMDIRFKPKEYGGEYTPGGTVGGLCCEQVLVPPRQKAEPKDVAQRIRERIVASGKRFYASDNISQFIKEGELDELVKELTLKFNDVLDTMVISRDDPNSQETGRRLAKMYINELFSGRYQPSPKVTAFPNVGESKYDGMLVVRADLKSVCAHHHQAVIGTAYIGIIPNDKVIGLSKYVRIAQHLARRGTLQEELTTAIANEIEKVTGSRDVGVYIIATHGCMSCRGVNQDNSFAQTTVLRGCFLHDPLAKKEFFDQVAIQENRR